MARKVTFIKACTVRVLPDDTGRIPRATKDYPAGWSGLIPDHHYQSAMRQGALANDDAGAGQPAGETEGDSGRTKKGDARRP